MQDAEERGVGDFDEGSLADAADARELDASGVGEAPERNEAKRCAHSLEEGELLDVPEVGERMEAFGEEIRRKTHKGQDLPQVQAAKNPIETPIEAGSDWRGSIPRIHWDGSDALPEVLLDSCMNAVRGLREPLRIGDASTFTDDSAQGQSSPPLDSATQDGVTQEGMTAHNPWKAPTPQVGLNSQAGQSPLQGHHSRTGHNPRRTSIAVEVQRAGRDLLQDQNSQAGKELLQSHNPQANTGSQAGRNRGDAHSPRQEPEPAKTQGGGDESSCPATPIILIDGLSGAGKSTLARVLACSLASTLSRELDSHGFVEPVHVLALDSLYEGWHGLEAGSTIASRIAKDLAEARPAHYRPWDWENEFRGEEVVIEPGAPLIIEGCGALTRESGRYAALALWVEAVGGEKERYRRAIGRDGELFRAWWETWAEQDLGRLEGTRPVQDATQLVGEAQADPLAHAGVRLCDECERPVGTDPLAHAGLRAAGISSTKVFADPRAYADLLVLT